MRNYFKYRLLRKLLSLSLVTLLVFSSFGQLLSTPTQAQTTVRLGILSDSSSDEYRANDNRGNSNDCPNNPNSWCGVTTLSWDELLHDYRGFDMGPWGSRVEPRRDGYEHNWARSGASSESIISSGAYQGIATDVANGQIDIVYLGIGSNDFAYYTSGVIGTTPMGSPIYNGTLAGQELTNRINQFVSKVTLALDTILAASPTVKVILSTVPDAGVSPYWQSQFPDASKRQLVTNAINTTNAQLSALLTTRPNVSIFDSASVANSIFSQVDQNGNLAIGTELISLTVSGNEPHHAILFDNIHAGTVFGGLFANSLISNINQALGTQVAPFSDAELIANSGIHVASPSPTIQPSPTVAATPSALPSPTIIPTPSPTQMPSPTPSATIVPSATPIASPSTTPVPTTISLSVAASSDDMYQDNGTNSFTGSTVAIGGNTNYYAGFRFLNVPIPVGSTITNAYLRVYNPSAAWIGVNADIYAENIASSSTFTTSSLPQQRAATSAKVTYSSNSNWPASTWQQLSAIPNVIQEVVNRVDWNSGNSLSVLLHGVGSQQYARKFITSFDGSAVNAPQLVVTYLAPVPSPSPSPTLIPTPSPTIVPTPLPSPTVTPTPVPTVTPTPSPSPTIDPTPTPIPTATPTPIPSPTVAPSPTIDPTPTVTPSPTIEPSPTITPTPSPDPTVLPSPTPTVEPSATPSPTSDPTPAPTPSVTPTPEPSVLPSPTIEPSPTVVPTPTPSPTEEPTPSPVPTVTPSPTATPSPSPSASPVTRIVELRNHPNNATQKYFVFDGVIENGSTLTEVTSSRFTYSSGWTLLPTSGINGSPARYSITAGNYFRITTTANSLTLQTAKDVQIGSFDVYINNVFQYTYNGYSTTTQFITVPIF